MELYTLDSLLRRNQVVDKFESLIWTERFASFGDFELSLLSTFENRSIFKTGVQLAMNESYRVMTVETVEDSTDADGKMLLSVKGRSLEVLLDDRVAYSAISNLTATPKWTLTGTPSAIARKIFNDICVLGTLDAGDIIPFITSGNIFPADTIPESTVVIAADLEVQTVYSAIKNLCDLYDMGFRLIRNFDTSQLYFNIYMGSDRTASQMTLPAVVFSANLDNLQNTSELNTIAGYKDVAYVYSPQGAVMVYPSNIDSGTEGFDRRVLLVNVTDITVTVPDTPEETLAKQKETIASNLESTATTAPEKAAAAAARTVATTARKTADASMLASAAIAIGPYLQQRGLEELSNNRKLSAFDGELNQNSAYKYGIDYQLGDLVEMRNVDGFVNTMQVTEQIFVSDHEGERSYPTLSLNSFLSPGSWASWDYSQVWEDMGLTVYWADV